MADRQSAAWHVCGYLDKKGHGTVFGTAYKKRWFQLDVPNKRLAYRFPGRRYFAIHTDESLCARSGRRQRPNAAKIIQDGLRLRRTRSRRRYFVQGAATATKPFDFAMLFARRVARARS